MRTNMRKILTTVLIFCLSAGWIQAQSAVEQIAPNVTQINWVKEAKFTPAGKFLVLQSDVDFNVIPTERLDRITGNLDESNSSWTAGWAKGFMPSGRILVKSRRGLYTLDPQTGKGDEIYFASAEDEEKGTYLNDGEMVVVSENLIISGDSGIQMGFNQNNIIRFDVRRGSYTKGTKITGFNNALPSPDGRYITYRHGYEDDAIAEIYDVARDVSRRISERFDFKRHFPKYADTLVEPLAWVSPNRFVATVDENQFEKVKASPNPLDIPDTPAWLVLFDAASGKIVWKRQLDDYTDAPVGLQFLSKTKAFFQNSRGIYQIALADGNFNKLPRIEGDMFSISPDGKQMAYVDENRIIVSAAASEMNKKTAVELPKGWREGLRLIEWSPDGKRLMIFDAERLLIVRLGAESEKESKQ